ncbi:hypothetical protein ACFC0M_32050 [Streptomyces sp. NPDC056149]|uniref:hypothetical protein n=1 Tax=Streptomyces sp. NPDC056149 TaxID=3345728 RepID=UPI0035D9D809
MPCQPLRWPEEVRDLGNLASPALTTERELELTELLVSEMTGVEVEDLHDVYCEALSTPRPVMLHPVRAAVAAIRTGIASELADQAVERAQVEDDLWPSRREIERLNSAGRLGTGGPLARRHAAKRDVPMRLDRRSTRATKLTATCPPRCGRAHCRHAAGPTPHRVDDGPWTINVGQFWGAGLGDEGPLRQGRVIVAASKYSLELRERAVRMYRTTDPKPQNSCPGRARP